MLLPNMNLLLLFFIWSVCTINRWIWKRKPLLKCSKVEALAGWSSSSRTWFRLVREGERNAPLHSCFCVSVLICQEDGDCDPFPPCLFCSQMLHKPVLPLLRLNVASDTETHSGSGRVSYLQPTQFLLDISSFLLWWQQHISVKLEQEQGDVHHRVASPLLLPAVCKHLGTEETSWSLGEECCPILDSGF